MEADNVVELEDVRRRRARRGWCSRSLLTLIAIDVLTFTGAVWLMSGVPEAFDAAANSANAGAFVSRQLESGR